MTEFIPFPKIARYSREVICTEKIDGTNASIYIGEDGEFLTGSRTRWIDPMKDNHGFAAWAYMHKEELMTLGPGRHFGEWWGQGIQRNYGLTEKRFSLFNVQKWCLHGQTPAELPRSPDPKVSPKFQQVLPPCVGLVPIIWRGPLDSLRIDGLMIDFKTKGSLAAPGFMNPEGIVVFHTAANTAFKKTFDKDAEGKGQNG